MLIGGRLFLCRRMFAAQPDARASFALDYNVPRGTLAKFDLYAEMLVRWQERFNLVAPSTIPYLWHRHFSDSAQLTMLSQKSGERWLDIGSGAGFPSLVIALLLPGHFHLVEATSKKCRFLAEVVDALDLSERVSVYNGRVETMSPRTVDVITARACAPLTQVFKWGERHGRLTDWLLLKGRTVAKEISVARQTFDFDYELVPSRTDPDARIVVARNVRRRQG